MRNLVKDIERNCPECECSVEDTVKYLYRSGDLTQTSEYYLEIWNFYTDLLDMFKGKKYAKKKARELTLENFKISFATFKNVRKRAMHL